MTADIVNHLWQSTVVVGAIALLTLLLRRNRAQVRYALWLTASMKFCVPLALLIGAGGALATSTIAPMAPPSQVSDPSSFSMAIDQLAQPFDTVVISAPASLPSIDWQAWAVAIWVAGIVGVVAVRVRGWWRIRAAIRASTVVAIDGIATDAGVVVRSAPSSIGPGVVGWRRPVLLLPVGLEQLPRPQLEAVIAHELCHVRRRDTLTGGAHMVVETVFWFHPLVWWIGSRLVDERERACDEAVLALGIDPGEYATGILNVCRHYVGTPLANVPAVTGADLRGRVEAILLGRVGVPLSSIRRLALAAVAAVALGAPIWAGVLTAPLRALAAAGQANAGAPSFEVASIKPCAPEDVPPRPSPTGAGGGGARSGGVGGGNFSPGRAYWPCVEVRNLIHTAYVATSDASRDPLDPINNWPAGVGSQNADGTKTLVRGGPAWVYSDKYTVEVKAASSDRPATMGLMLRSLLEARFKLKVHPDVEDVSMFALVVAKGGLKIKPLPEGGCTTDRSKGAIVLSEAARLGVTPTCGTVSAGLHDGNWRYEHGGQGLVAVASMLSSELGTTVLDRSGVSGIFNMTWEFAPDDATPRAWRMVERYGPQPPIRPTAPTLFTALEQQLGVRLEPIKGQRAFFVIDHIERPTPDGQRQ